MGRVTPGAPFLAGPVARRGLTRPTFALFVLFCGYGIRVHPSSSVVELKWLTCLPKRSGRKPFKRGRRSADRGVAHAKEALRRMSFRDNFPSMNFDYHQYFERRRKVCGGELVVKGTRVTVRTLLASLAEGASAEEIRADFPTVSAEALRAVVAFAAASAEEDLPIPPVPTTA